MSFGLVAGGMGAPSSTADLASFMDRAEDFVEPKKGESHRSQAPSRRGREDVPPAAPGETRPLFLTFDDGPLACTGKILELLAASGNKATFFVIGRNLVNAKLREMVLKAMREGHDIANHSYDHPDFSTISATRAEKEIVSTYNLIEELVKEAGADTERQNRFFRFPYGVEGSRNVRAACEKVLSELNYRIAWWDVDTHDWQMEVAFFPRSSSSVLASLRHARPSDVVLMHDRDKTALHLPEMLRLLTYQQLMSIPLSKYDSSPA